MVLCCLPLGEGKRTSPLLLPAPPPGSSPLNPIPTQVPYFSPGPRTLSSPPTSISQTPPPSPYRRHERKRGLIGEQKGTLWNLFHSLTPLFRGRKDMTWFTHSHPPWAAMGKEDRGTGLRIGPYPRTSSFPWSLTLPRDQSFSEAKTKARPRQE